MRTVALSLLFSFFALMIFGGLHEPQVSEVYPILWEGRVRPALGKEDPSLAVIPLKRHLDRWTTLEKAKEASSNISAYSDEALSSILQTKTQESKDAALISAFKEIEGKTFQKTAHGDTRLPFIWQLKLETWTLHINWPFLLLSLYLTAAFLWTFTRLSSLAFSFTVAALTCHTAFLLLKTFILGRPPVSNMAETIAYVPWVTAVLGLLWPGPRSLLLALASWMGGVFFLLSLVLGMHLQLEHVQPVLDSRMWLTIHVLMVVGSYGVFLLASCLGHYYLGKKLLGFPEPHDILKPMTGLIYLGVTLLILGTILGGVWALQSWGRFWDWDPKEAWAFIASTWYLCWIHAFRFGKIKLWGLCFGAVSGFVVISFTWYGVNYLLGTGLHSYGFGSGGVGWYIAFVALETLFLGMVVKNRLDNKPISHIKTLHLLKKFLGKGV